MKGRFVGFPWKHWFQKLFFFFPTNSDETSWACSVFLADFKYLISFDVRQLVSVLIKRIS